jgi:hypothetical protein
MPSSLLLLVFGSVFSDVNVAIASQFNPTTISRSHPRSTQTSNLDFSDVGRPRRRQGGGSRGSCLIANQPPLTALVPESSTGYTLSQSPSFWFYLPYHLGKGHAMEFVLKDSQENLVYSETIADRDIPPGIFNLRLPDTVILDTQQSYEWYLVVQCDATNAERFVFVNGAIRRLDRPDLQPQMANLEQATNPEFYITENLWYDAVDATAAQLQKAPQNREFRQQWENLLQQMGLSNLTTASMTDCCTVNRISPDGLSLDRTGH